MNKSDLKQLSFFAKDEVQEKPKITPPYDATICDKCLCSKCMKNCETHVSNTTVEEAKTLDEPCWNCDECYFYGMDASTLSQRIVRFKCDEFKMSKYYIDLYARKQRRKLKIIK
ncbi:hypothetical protein U728_761 [Clostridium botulinum 202F]|nr:hypothetical protein U728_761 [Clostridium botulinum 202F]KON14716.1 hypothetical protein ACP50_00775 [Clostridium botulinum]MBY6988461.1 hypothetical protein [Clostridium botulinum]NFH01690.1 hypothetical protein [Clostridium botulinum]NFP41032.1 hypothetical protein [Clostridium botulinum]